MLEAYHLSDAFNVLRYYDNNPNPGMIICLIGKSAENLEPAINKKIYDVRECSPYFFPEDKVQWIIR